MKRTFMILDRDGTINEMVVNPDHGIIDSPLHPSQVRISPETLSALKTLQDCGCVFSIATNQPAAAKGKTTLDNLKAVHARVLEILQNEKIQISSSHLCFHRSEDQCSCRKPKPELLAQAFTQNPGHLQQNSWMVGDGVTDIQAGASLGLKTAFIGSRKNEMFQAFERLSIQPTFWGSTLTDFAQWFRNNG